MLETVHIPSLSPEIETKLYVCLLHQNSQLATVMSKTVPSLENCQDLCTYSCITITTKLIVALPSEAGISSTARSIFVKLLLCHLLSEGVNTRTPVTTTSCALYLRLANSLQASL